MYYENKLRSLKKQTFMISNYNKESINKDYQYSH